MLTLVIVDQYVACTLPLRYRSVMTLYKSNRILMGTWAAAAVLEIPLLITIGRRPPVIISSSKGPPQVRRLTSDF